MNVVITVNWRNYEVFALYTKLLFYLDCGCHQPGTIGYVGICDMTDGQCACKQNVGGGDEDAKRICSECHDGFFGLQASNGFGCKHCQCDVGGTAVARGELAVCDKDGGQCMCRPGIIGRRSVLKKILTSHGHI
jgi:hypothetical protein